MSTVHGLLATLLCGYHTYFIHHSCGQKNTTLEEITIIMSVGYFSYDLIAMTYYKLLDGSMLLHHLMCIFGMYTSIQQGYSLNYVVSATFVLEISNPVMHLRLIIKHLGLRYTKLYEILELSYISNSHINYQFLLSLLVNLSLYPSL